MIDNLLLATRNRGKIEEIAPFLNGIVKDLISLAQIDGLVDIEETGKTYEENAIRKAESLFKQTGIVTLADDSGLEVDALDGQPGVFSARFAGKDAADAENNEKLLNLMRHVPVSDRGGRFRCVMALAMTEETRTFEGVVEGEIALSPVGIHGFGYDPLFIPHGYDKTFAELGNDIKSRISHRIRALEKVGRFIKTI
ncbi:hypothetical protein AMJ80_01195 [bacterium SM23_31]|nr:MAG: hypothetical protein AMJ80_01195 [bacterium SM23_31]